MHDSSEGVPRLGAWVEGASIRFRTWAPAARSVEVQLEDGRRVPLEPEAGGFFGGGLRGAVAGLRYRLRVDGAGPFPDPWSHSQPEGVHGPSEVITHDFPWTDAAWKGLTLEGSVLLEVHVGAATRDGTFEALIPLLPFWHHLGVTALELMPVASFPGRWNWGYDGVDLLAPQASYGGPTGLKRLVDAAHALGLGVLLDVVYNHLGPDGNYVGVYSPHYYTDRHTTPWGAALNYDAEHSAVMRALALRSAELWVRDYHLDGLRLDATHAIADASRPHLLETLTARVKAAAAPRQVLVIAEDGLNREHLTRARSAGGFGLDAQWSDDFHHVLRRAFAGDSDGYYRDFKGTAGELARVLGRNWLYEGEPSEHYGHPRGSDASMQSAQRFVVFLQNHDQVGNRAQGDRLGASVSEAAYRAMTALLLCAPQTPLLFMGQEWNATTPFLYFTDHEEALGRAVTAGRRREFEAFGRFDEAEVPDPQDPSTFVRSQLDWSEHAQAPNACMLLLYRELLTLRRSLPALVGGTHRARGLSDTALELIRSAGAERLALFLNVRGSLEHQVPEGCEVLLWTEEARFGGQGGEPPLRENSLLLEGPQAVLLRLPEDTQERLPFPR